MLPLAHFSAVQIARLGRTVALIAVTSCFFVKAIMSQHHTFYVV